MKLHSATDMPAANIIHVMRNMYYSFNMYKIYNFNVIYIKIIILKKEKMNNLKVWFIKKLYYEVRYIFKIAVTECLPTNKNKNILKYI